MKKPLKVIYITGVGDQGVNLNLQRKAVRTWNWYGVEAELFQMDWGSPEAWQPKFKRLLSRIDELINQGDNVALVGASAGASAAINAFEARRAVLAGLVCLSGKISYPETLGAGYKKRNPALLASVQASQRALEKLTPKDRRRILSRYALVDGIVPARDSFIPDARNRRVPTFGHIPTIALQITLGAHGFIRFLKNLAPPS